jgi:hypothetical protein
MVEFTNAKTGTIVAGNVWRWIPDKTAADDVFVEIYAYEKGPQTEDWNPATWGEKVGSQVTKTDGKFSFRVRPGTYRLRFSISGEWNCSYVTVKAERFGFGHKRLNIEMRLGQ